MYVLGISCHFHDAAAALLRDGELVAASEEERFSRKKHDNGFPARAIQFCLDQAGIEAADLDHVVFYEKPLLKLERIISQSTATFPRSYGVFRESTVAWFDEKLWIKSLIQTKLGINPKKILFVEHHLSHAASAMFVSPFREAAVLTIDGVGEWTTAAIGHATAGWNGGESSGVKLTRELRFPHSLGLLYSAFTAFLGFRVNSGEYKVMGMAPYGRPKYIDKIHKVARLDSSGGLALDMRYFSFHHSLSQTFNGRFVELFGQPRRPESEFFCPTTHPTKDHPDWDDGIAAQNQYYADIAASIQLFTEEAVLKMARYAHCVTGSKNVVLAGGVALNSVANGRLVREGPFEHVYIQPAAGDAGGALGAALYVYHVILGKPRSFVMNHAYWGAEYDESRLRQSANNLGLECEEMPNSDTLVDQTVDSMQDGKVVGWYQGRAEWGPRALGNRSILADPRTASMKEVVNTKIKFREPFRPFAPAVLEDKAAEYFTTDSIAEQHLPRYMLMVSPVAEDKQDKIEAVCHGGTGRLQTVRQEWNPLYHKLIKRFGEATGVSVLLNTSFNLRGEPIVDTPENALHTFCHSDIDSLVMGPFVVKKPADFQRPELEPSELLD